YTLGPLRLVDKEELLEIVPKERSVPNGTAAAFVSEEAGLAFPVIGIICSFLLEHEIALKGPHTKPQRNGEVNSIRTSVKDWYNEFGWQRNARGLYNDTAGNSNMTLDAVRLYELLSH